MSSLIISMIETERTRSAPIGPGRELEADFRRAGLALLQELPAGFRKLRQLARLVVHEVLGRHAREHQRRQNSPAGRRAALLMMICACSINRRTARSSSLTNCPWMFMGVSPARFAEFFSRRLSLNRTAASREKALRAIAGSRFRAAPERCTMGASSVTQGADQVARKANKSNVVAYPSKKPARTAEKSAGLRRATPG